MMMIIEYCCFGNIRRYLFKQRESFIDQVTLDGDLDYDIRSKSKYLFLIKRRYKCCMKYRFHLFIRNTSSESKVGKNTTELYTDNGTQITSDCNMIPNEDECYNNNDDYERMTIKPLGTHDLICWSYQVARGMEYLASKKVNF